MMEAKHPFCPIFIKQEPRDPCSDNDGSNCNATNLSRNSTTAVASSSSSSSGLSRLQDGPVDLRAISAVTRDPQPWSSLDALILPTSAGTGVWRRGGGGGGGEGGNTGSPRVFPEVSSNIRTLRHPLANDATTMMTSDPDLPKSGGRPGKITPREDCPEGSHASDFSCVACFHDVLGQCAHRLRSTNNSGSGMLRGGCSAVSQLGAGDRAAFDAADEDLAARGSKEHKVDDDDLLRESLAGLGSESEVATFTCEDCDMRFSSRDTYAMHMLLRAKNEACVPGAPQQRGNGSGTSTGKSDVSTTSSGSQITISPAAPGPNTVVSSSAAAVLLGKHLPADPKQEENGDFHSLNGGSSLFGEPIRRKVSDPAFCLGLGLGLDVGRSADYRVSWWTKYLPDGAEGVAIGSDAEGPVTHLPLVCYLCGELFSNRDSLAMHVLFHTRDTASATITSSTDGSSQWHKPLRADSFLLNHGTYSGAPSRLRQPPPIIAETIPAVTSAGASTSGSGSTSHISSSASLTSESLVRQVEGEACRVTSGGEDERGIFAEETERREHPHVAGAALLQGAASKSSVAVALDNQTPQVRGKSAPAAATTSELGDREYGGLAVTQRSKTSTPDLVKPRPLSADHVVGSRVLGVSRRSLQEESVWDRNRWKNPLDSHPLGGNPFLGVQLEPLRGSCGVYRLDRLRKLRTGRGGAYGRAPARGRPPMTIHGVVGSSRHYRPDTFPSTPTSDPSFSLGSMSFSRLPTVTTSFGPLTPSSSATPSTRLTSMLKLLTSHDHEVSACLYCEVIFAERTLHQLHMGLHNVNNPWQCNACGQVCASRLHFATHALHF